MAIVTTDHSFIYTEAPFPECHAATIAVVGATLVAAWFGGTGEKFPDVGIWLSRRAKAGGAWSVPVRVAKVAEIAHWNPVLLSVPDGAVHLWFKVGVDVPHWETWSTISRDAGETWETPRPLFDGDTGGGRGPVKNKPIVLSDGTWLAGASTERTTWEGFVDRSDDQGKTWTASAYFDRTALGPEHGVIQPTLWESAPGIVHALMRSSCGYAPRTDSIDGGRTWSPLVRTVLPNNNSGLDLVRLDDGTLALVSNPIEKDWGIRTPLRLSLSFDNGHTWPESLDLETDDGEYSYPAIVAEGRTLFVAYTWKRERIRSWQGSVV
jgi:predicted neuraminidase